MNFNSTKERIIYESLRLFSEKGFDGVSMREIAAAVDIKAASLYAHFKGKEAIYQAIVDTMKQRYNQETMLLHIDGSDAKADVSVYKNISMEQLYSIGEQLFLFFVHDEYTKMYRKMLTMEQFKNPVLAAEFSKQYYDEAISCYEKSFELQAAPRYTDSLESIAHINEIKGEYQEAIATYQRIIELLRIDWNITFGATINKYLQKIDELASKQK